MKKTTMKSFWGIMVLMFICSNLSAQNQMSKNENRVHSMLDGMFLNSKVSSRMPLAMPQLKTTTLMKVKQAEPVKYQLDSLIATPYGNEMNTPKGKIECKYDSLGRMILFYVSQSNDSTNVLEFNYKYVYRYGDNYTIKDDYEAYNGPVKFTGRTKTIYDQNNRIQTVKEGNDTINFENNADRNEYIYTNNLLSTINTYSFGFTTPSGMTRYFYDALGRDTTKISYSLDWNTKIMFESTKDNYYYDVNNDIINSKTYYSFNGLWDLKYNNDFIYNNHDCISYTEKDITDSLFTAQLKYISSYNKSILMSDIDYGYTFTDFPYTFKSQLKNIDLYMSNGNDSLLIGGYALYYSESKKSTGIDNISKIGNEFVKYNAVSQTIMLQNTELGNSNQLQLYNLSGTQILNKPISASGSVSVDKMGSGLYVYKIISSGKTIVGKILVQ